MNIHSYLLLIYRFLNPKRFVLKHNSTSIEPASCSYFWIVMNPKITSLLWLLKSFEWKGFLFESCISFFKLTLGFSSFPYLLCFLVYSCPWTLLALSFSRNEADGVHPCGVNTFWHGVCGWHVDRQPADSVCAIRRLLRPLRAEQEGHVGRAQGVPRRQGPPRSHSSQETWEI